MSIEKKSLISTLKTTKKANVAKEDLSGQSKSSGIGGPSKKLGGLGGPSKKLGGLGGPSKKLGGLGGPSKKLGGVGGPSKKTGLGSPSVKF